MTEPSHQQRCSRCTCCPLLLASPPPSLLPPGTCYPICGNSNHERLGAAPPPLKSPWPSIGIIFGRTTTLPPHHHLACTAPHRHHLNLNLKTPWRPIGIRHKREDWVREKSKRYLWSWRRRRSRDEGSPRLSGSAPPRDGLPWPLPPRLKSTCRLAWCPALGYVRGRDERSPQVAGIGGDGAEGSGSVSSGESTGGGATAPKLP